MYSGSCRKQCRLLATNGQKKLQEFIRDGGGYVGICAGAYLASTRCLAMSPTDAVKPWMRGQDYVNVELTKKGVDLFSIPRIDPCNSDKYTGKLNKSYLGWDSMRWQKSKYHGSRSMSGKKLKNTRPKGQIQGTHFLYICNCSVINSTVFPF